MGRIFVGNPQLFDGYSGGGDKQRRNGLMATGDVGRFDAAGRLFVKVADDDMIVSGGENVFPRRSRTPSPGIRRSPMSRPSVSTTRSSGNVCGRSSSCATASRPPRMNSKHWSRANSPATRCPATSTSSMSCPQCHRKGPAARTAVALTAVNGNNFRSVFHRCAILGKAIFRSVRLGTVLAMNPTKNSVHGSVRVAGVLAAVATAGTLTTALAADAEAANYRDGTYSAGTGNFTRPGGPDKINVTVTH